MASFHLHEMSKTASPSLLGAFARGRKHFQALKWAFNLDWFHLWHEVSRQVQSLECVPVCFPASLLPNDRRSWNTTPTAPRSLRNKWKQLSQDLSEELSPSRHWNLEPLPSRAQLRWLNLYLTYTSIIWIDTFCSTLQGFSSSVVGIVGSNILPFMRKLDNPMHRMSLNKISF